MNAFNYSDLRTTDDVSEFVQRCRFALRKPPFYPLNYGDVFQKEEGRRMREKIQRSEDRDQPPSPRLRRAKEDRSRRTEVRGQPPARQSRYGGGARPEVRCQRSDFKTEFADVDLASAAEQARIELVIDRRRNTDAFEIRMLGI